MKLTHLLLLLLSLNIALCQDEDSSSSAPSWNSSESENCIACWDKFSDDAIYCRSSSGKGYCCNGINSASYCTESGSTGCSVDLNYDMNRYAYCLEPKEPICGTESTFTLSTSSRSVSLSSLTTKQKNGSVC